MKLIDFDRHFQEAEQDKTLKAKLTRPEALSGVFNWVLEGLALYRQEGLTVPESIATATAA